LINTTAFVQDLSGLIGIKSELNILDKPDEESGVVRFNLKFKLFNTPIRELIYLFFDFIRIPYIFATTNFQKINVRMIMNLKRLILSAGMAAVLFYLLHVVLGGYLWTDYNQLQQPISDLTATGAPNRGLMVGLTSVYGVLALIFAVGFTVFESRKHCKPVMWGGISLIMMHIVSISYGFFPQDLPGAEVSFKGTMHIVVTGLIVPFTILSPFLVGFGFVKESSRKAFGIYSIISGFLILIFGSMCGIFFANKLLYFGLVERMNIGVLQLWTFLLSFKLTRTKL
jgi:hypothetical protein